MYGHSAGRPPIFTERAVFLGGIDNPAIRERGSGELLDNQDAEPRREPATTSRGEKSPHPCATPGTGACCGTAVGARRAASDRTTT
jgi:hypothetical protein